MPKVKLNEYTPIRSLLYYAVNEYQHYTDQYIKIMVRDAIEMANDANSRYMVNRRMYRYSHYLSINSMTVVRRMNPEQLTIEDYRTLFEIFKKL